MLKYSIIRRDDRPILFRITIAMRWMLAGLALLLALAGQISN